jgi:hypothetical protein
MESLYVLGKEKVFLAVSQGLIYSIDLFVLAVVVVSARSVIPFDVLQACLKVTFTHIDAGFQVHSSFVKQGFERMF